MDPQLRAAARCPPHQPLSHQRIRVRRTPVRNEFQASDETTRATLLSLGDGEGEGEGWGWGWGKGKG